MTHAVDCDWYCWRCAMRRGAAGGHARDNRGVDRRDWWKLSEKLRRGRITEVDLLATWVTDDDLTRIGASLICGRSICPTPELAILAWRIFGLSRTWSI